MSEYLKAQKNPGNFPSRENHRGLKLLDYNKLYN